VWGATFTHPSGQLVWFENFAAYLKGKQVKIPVLETYFDIFAATLKRTS